MTSSIQSTPVSATPQHAGEESPRKSGDDADADGYGNAEVLATSDQETPGGSHDGPDADGADDGGHGQPPVSCRGVCTGSWRVYAASGLVVTAC